MSKTDETLIFIVEDDPQYLHALKHSLEQRHFSNIKVFTSGEECLENLDQKPQVILLDFLLGEGKMNGLQVLKEIKKFSPESQVVFLTGLEKLEVALETVKNGAYDYVVKTEAAFERIRNLLKRITFEAQIREENLRLKKSRKIISIIIAALLLGIFTLLFLQFR